MELKGCQEGKGTPKLVEVKCPKCKECVEIFVKMGGSIGQTGTTTADETCPSCGYVIEAGRLESEFEKYVPTII